MSSKELGAIAHILKVLVAFQTYKKKTTGSPFNFNVHRYLCITSQKKMDSNFLKFSRIIEVTTFLLIIPLSMNCLGGKLMESNVTSNLYKAIKNPSFPK